MEISAKGIPRWLRIAVVALIYGSLLAGGHWGSGWLIDLVGVDLGTGAQSHDLHVMIAGVVFYAALMAIPFVPGMEISLGLLAVFGPKVAMAIYAATVRPGPFLPDRQNAPRQSDRHAFRVARPATGQGPSREPPALDR